jgi:two-component system KDP operon response regulator KdpE
MARPRVLVVDDDPWIQDLLREVLTEDGYQVVQARTAYEAMASLTVERPDLILLDLGLPDLDGQFIASRVVANSDWFDIPIVVMTARADPSNRSLARIYGARDYVVKPFEIQDLLDRLRQARAAPV